MQQDDHARPFWLLSASEQGPPGIKDIYQSPGHLLRRAHQISVSIFMDELGRFGLTPIQYASLLAIRDTPSIDQRTLGRTIAIDRSTIGTVVKSLETKSLITRRTPDENLRIKVLSLTSKGEELLNDTVTAIATVQERLLAPLSVEKQEVFMHLLLQLVNINNEMSRAPLVIMSDGNATETHATEERKASFQVEKESSAH